MLHWVVWQILTDVFHRRLGWWVIPDGGSKSPWNVGQYLPHHKVQQYITRQLSSCSSCENLKSHIIFAGFLNPECSCSHLDTADPQKLHAMIINSIIIIWAGVGKSVQCLTTDWTTVVRSPTEAKDFSSSLCIHTSSEAHPPSYPMGTGVLSRGQSTVRAWRWPLTPSSAEVKNE
jgi:hypothetical protein